MKETRAISRPCETCSTLLEPFDVRCPVCATPGPESRFVLDERAAILRCRGCGSVMAYDAEVRAPRCQHCRGVMQVHCTEATNLETYYVPFLVSPTQARAALQSWLRREDPSHTRSLLRGNLDALEPHWLIGWVIDAEVEVNWVADLNYFAAPAAWASYTGQARLSLQRVPVLPADSAPSGLARDRDLARLEVHYDLSRLDPAPHGPSGTRIEPFELSRSAVRKNILRALERAAMRQLLPTLPGSRQRNARGSILPLGLRKIRVAFPAYVLEKRRRGKLYRVIVHGQDARVVTGTLPWAWHKPVLMVILLLVALWASRFLPAL